MVIVTFACVDGAGGRRRGGESWMMKDLYVQCHIDADGTGAVRNVGCVDQYGRRKKHGAVWTDVGGQMRCVLSGGEWRIESVGCRDVAGQRRAVGERWKDGEVLVSCALDLNGLGVVEPVTCKTKSGAWKVQGAEWEEGGIRVRCYIDNQGNPSVGPVRSGRYRIGKSVDKGKGRCVDKDGNTRPQGDEWIDSNRYVKCIADSFGNFLEKTVACATNTGVRKENGDSWDDNDGYKYVCRIVDLVDSTHGKLVEVEDQYF